MATHHQTGQTGEMLARRWLQERGFCISHCNWRHGHDEIDIIARRDDVLHFVEVKTRRSMRYGGPETAVTSRKLKSWLRAIDAYIYLNPGRERIQMDIVCVEMKIHSPISIWMLEDISF